MRGDGLEFLADLRGRWLATVATVRPDRPAGEKVRAQSLLQIWDAHKGTLLASKTYDGELRSLTSTADGSVIYGMLAETLPATTRYEQTYGRVALQRFEIAPAVLAGPVEAEQAWDAQACLIEDELPGARAVGDALRQVEVVFDLPLPFVRGGAKVCKTAMTAWGLTPDGALWIDHGAYLERIDPSNGQAMGRVATPRSDRVCSDVSFERRQFLSWQGDTVTLRDFSTDGRVSPRRVLAVQPGWQVLSARWLSGGRVGVRWVKAEWTGRADDEGATGSAQASIYDANARGARKPLRVVQGRAQAGSAVFEEELDGSDVFDDEEQSSRPVEAEGSYVWEISHFRSVRARPRGKQPGRLGDTVLWDGFSAASRDGTDGLLPERVMGLGGALGLVTAGPWWTLYDVATRSRIARLNVPNAHAFAWSHPYSMLLFSHRIDALGEIRLRGVRLVSPASMHSLETEK